MRQKKNMSNKILNVLENVARKEIQNSIFTWPPHCGGMYYQPKRPKVKSYK